MKRKHNSIDEGYAPSLFRNNYHAENKLKQISAKSSSQAVISSRYQGKRSPKQSSSLVSEEGPQYQRLSNSEIKSVKTLLMKERMRKQEDDRHTL